MLNLLDEKQIYNTTMIMGVCAIIVAFVLARGLKNIKSDQTINVTGSAKQLIISDLGILKGVFNIGAPTA
nr:hypothetical protein [uncultured Pedobacter sp.]